MLQVLNSRTVSPLRRVSYRDEGIQKSKPRRILDFDIESRPLGWLGNDFMHQEVTAIASCWIVNGEPEDVQVDLLTRRKDSQARMLRRFRDRYGEADIVTGHYIRNFDLPQLNGAYIEHGMDPLDAKLTHDTKNDLIKHAGISKSQENLSAMLGVEAPKVRMNVPAWREANRLTKEGMTLTKERVVGDILQHVAMRQRLLELGWLKPPRVWRPT